MSVVATGAEQESIGEQLLKQELDAAQAHLAEIKVQATAAGIACETQVVQAGQPSQEIVGEAERLEADLIITGRRGRRGMARFMVGDATVRIIGHAPCSVLVVPRAAELSGRHFLLASDGSRHSDAAAVVAGNLAKLCDTPLTVVSATLPGHSKERRREATQAVNRTVSHLKQEDIRVKGETPEGVRADEVIVQRARATNSDLIVLGSHGRTGLERILLGSTAERVLDQTSCAVLVVKAT
jgi:nucleotide-binding universal stress UspA family protein